MATISTALDKIGELRTSDLLDRASALNLDASTTQLVVASAILEKLGRVKSHFAYRQPLAAENPALASTVARQFAHADWVDGESVVQAEESISEEGFNKRFHAIEADLDALAVEVRRAFAEMAGLRRQLASMFEDLRLALERLDGKLVDEVVKPSYQIDPRFLTQEIVTAATPKLSFDPASIRDQIFERASTPGEGYAFGLPAKKLTREVFAGQSVDVWSTEAGMILVPVAKTASAAPGAAVVDAGLARVGSVASWIATNEASLQQELGDQPFAIETIKEKFGQVVLDDGSRLGDVLAGIPAGTQLQKLDDLTTAIADRQAEAITSDGRALDAVVGVVGLAQGDQPVTEVGVGSLRFLDDAQRGALEAAGITTVGALGAADAATVKNALGQAGLAVDAGSAARLVGIGRGLGRLRQG